VTRNTDKRTFVAEKFRIGYESATQAKGAGITLTDMLQLRHACKKSDMSEARARGICSLEGTLVRSCDLVDAFLGSNNNIAPSRLNSDVPTNVSLQR